MPNRAKGVRFSLRAYLSVLQQISVAQKSKSLFIKFMQKNACQTSNMECFAELVSRLKKILDLRSLTGF